MKNKSKTSLFLMELIIVILFFSIASVVCVQLFVNAYRTNIMTKETSQASLITQNLAEGYLGCEGDIQAMGELFDACTIMDDTLYMYYDNEWNTASGLESASYVASITPATGDEPAPGTIQSATIGIFNVDGTEISTQDISRYEQYVLE